MSGPTLLVASAAVYAVWGLDRNPPHGIGDVTWVLGALLGAEAFLTTFGLTVGRSDVYDDAVEQLRAADRDLEAKAAVSGSVPLDMLYRLANTTSVSATWLRRVLDPALPPRLSRRGHRAVVAGAWRRDVEEQKTLFGRQVLPEPDWDKDKAVRLAVATAADSRGPEARIALIGYLAAGILAVSILAGAGAGWHWTTHPSPAFFALVVLDAAAVAIAVTGLLARQEAMWRLAVQVSEEALPTVTLASSGWRLASVGIGAATDYYAKSPNRFARVVLAAEMLYWPAQTADALGTRTLPSDHKQLAEVEQARDLLAPMIALLPGPRPRDGVWVWRAPDVTAALLRARAGELIGEPAETLDGLLEEAARRVRTTASAPTGQGTADFSAPEAHLLLPEGWTAVGSNTARPSCADE